MKLKYNGNESSHVSIFAQTVYKYHQLCGSANTNKGKSFGSHYDVPLLKYYQKLFNGGKITLGVYKGKFLNGISMGILFYQHFFFLISIGKRLVSCFFYSDAPALSNSAMYSKFRVMKLMQNNGLLNGQLDKQYVNYTDISCPIPFFYRIMRRGI